MPHSTPDFTRRADLTELMDEPCSREEMRACLEDLSKLGLSLEATDAFLSGNARRVFKLAA